MLLRSSAYDNKFEQQEQVQMISPLFIVWTRQANKKVGEGPCCCNLAYVSTSCSLYRYTCVYYQGFEMRIRCRNPQNDFENRETSLMAAIFLAVGVVQNR